MPGFVDQAQLHARCRRRGGRGGLVAARGPRRPGRPRRRRRGPRRRRLAGGVGQRVLAARLPRPPLPPRHRRRARLGRQAARRPGQGPGGARCRWGRSCATADGAVVCDLAGDGDRFLVAEGGQGGRGNARFLSNRRRAPGLRRAGGEGPGALARHGAQADGRRGAGRVPQRRQVHADLDRVGGQAQDRRLPLHHARAASRRGPGRRRARRHRVRHGRHPRAGRGGGGGQGPGPPVPAPHRAGPGAGGAARPRRAATSVAQAPARPAARSCSPSSAPTGPSCSSGPGWWSGSKADRRAPTTRRAATWCSRRRPATGVGRAGRALAALVQEARADGGGRRPSSEVVVHRPVPEGVDVQRHGPAPGWWSAGPPSGRWRFSDLTDDGAQAEAVRRLRRLGVDRALARAGVPRRATRSRWAP